MLLLTVLALAAPPVPTWTAADRPAPDTPADVELPQAASETAQQAVAHTPAAFDAPTPSGHGWADEAALTFDLSGDVGRFYYVMATARGGALVAHWRQGPLAGEDVTSTFALQSPVELPALVQQVGSAHLSLVLVTVDAHDREICVDYDVDFVDSDVPGASEDYGLHGVERPRTGAGHPCAWRRTATARTGRAR